MPKGKRGSLVPSSSWGKKEKEERRDSVRVHALHGVEPPRYLQSKQGLPEWFNRERCRLVNQTAKKMASESATRLTLSTLQDLAKGDADCRGCVCYWMRRDMRVRDNWALLFSQHIATQNNIPIKVFYGLPDMGFNNYTRRHYDFLLKGLKLVEDELHQQGVEFCLAMGSPSTRFAEYANAQKCVAVVTDMHPLRPHRAWMSDVAQWLDGGEGGGGGGSLNQSAPPWRANGIPLFEVDAHNVVPVWHASDKQEVGARTLRPKLEREMPNFLRPYPPLGTGEPEEQNRRVPGEPTGRTDWPSVWKFVDDSVSKMTEEQRRQFEVPPLKWALAGTDAGMTNFDKFVKSRLKDFAKDRNNPNCDVSSNMSPWLNFGHVSAASLVLTLKAALRSEVRSKISEGSAAFIEEGVVRRELSDNFCYYNAHYDSLCGGAEWARETLEVHRLDKREYVYTNLQLENAETHDALWNAAQRQLVQEGKMHGFLRMYWAKKILEWTSDAATALSVGLDLNDRFSLDGNDPNGFVGVGWSVMGVHDMGWKERPIFGKIRYMNYAGCVRKFDVSRFERKYACSSKGLSSPKTLSKMKPSSTAKKEQLTRRRLDDDGDEGDGDGVRGGGLLKGGAKKQRKTASPPVKGE